jgi:hypothetical protein
MSLGVGLAQVVVPEDWSIELDATIDVGELWRYDAGEPVTEGVPVPEQAEIRGNLADGGQDWWFPDPVEVPGDRDGDGTRHTVTVLGEPGSPRLSLDVDVSAGVLVVFRVHS